MLRRLSARLLEQYARKFRMVSSMYLRTAESKLAMLVPRLPEVVATTANGMNNDAQ